MIPLALLLPAYRQVSFAEGSGMGALPYAQVKIDCGKGFWGWGLSDWFCAYAF